MVFLVAWSFVRIPGGHYLVYEYGVAMSKSYNYLVVIHKWS